MIDSKECRMTPKRLLRPAIRPSACLLLAALVWFLPGVPVRAAASLETDWPCIQRKVPEISAGMVWAGPPVEELQTRWRDDRQVSELAGRIAARALPIEEAQQAIADFAGGLGAEKNQKLTLLFAGALDIVNHDRASIIGGIGRYDTRQSALSKKIEAMTAEYWALPDDGTAEQQARRAELEQQILWDSRIYDERERSLSYICEQPVLLEQRIFALAREIMNHLD